MNFSIYQAFARIPLGIAVTIEFRGQRVGAIAWSRRMMELLWVVLAGPGVTLLGTGGVSAAGLGSEVAGQSPPSSTVLTGVLFALAAATAWAGYILLSASTGRRFSGSSGLVLAMCVGSVLVAPVAVISGGRALLKADVLGARLGIELLSSVIPYRFELETLRRGPARGFRHLISPVPPVAPPGGGLL